MNSFVRLALALGLTCALSALALGFTHRVTGAAIAQREAAERTAALADIFFRHRDASGRLSLRVENLPGETPVFALYAEGDAPGSPSFYAALGTGTGYNATSPIEVLAGFTAPDREARGLLSGYVEADRLPRAGVMGLHVVGWKVTTSQETPGLGEKIRDQATSKTWWGFVSGGNPAESPDRGTAFQKQFRGRLAEGLKLSRDGGGLRRSRRRRIRRLG